MKRYLMLVKNWCCSECEWIFKPNGNLIGESLVEMEVEYRRELNKAFGEHSCKEYPRLSKSEQSPSR